MLKICKLIYAACILHNFSIINDDDVKEYIAVDDNLNKNHCQNIYQNGYHGIVRRQQLNNFKLHFDNFVLFIVIIYTFVLEIVILFIFVLFEVKKQNVCQINYIFFSVYLCLMNLTLQSFTPVMTLFQTG